MENFIVSARKYRPVTFESVVGQHHITNTLKNAIKNNQLAQAFLFCGPRGVGKTTCARILAKTINCQNLGAAVEPCGECESCRSFQGGNSFNFHELDAASNNSVDDVRSLIEQVRIPPQAGKYKIYIIDEVHMLSQAAFNAFLKTLEEPPDYAIFILATTEKHKILPTILSRCQIFDFNRIRVEDMANHLASIAEKESITYDADGLHLIAQKADGGLRDALSMFDQIVSFSNRKVSYKAVIENLNILDYDYYFKITDYLLNEHVSKALLVFDDVLANGFDGNNFIIGLASHFRNLMVAKDTATLKLLEVSESIRHKYLQQSQLTSVSFLLSALNIANQCDLNYKTSKNQRLQVELSIIKICHITAALNLRSVINEHANQPDQAVQSAEQVKKKAESITPVAVPSTVPAESEAKAYTSQNPVAASGHLPVEAFAEPDIEPINKNTYSDKSKINLPLPGMSAPGSIIPNLNDLSEPLDKAEKKPEYISGQERTVFSEKQFLEIWSRYAAKAKQANKLNLLTLMTANPPALLDDFKIEIFVENKLQENMLLMEKIDLLNFLRVELNNFGIEITTKHVEQTARKKLYTANEKYQHMLEKNPSLEEFRKKFNLGID